MDISRRKRKRISRLHTYILRRTGTSIYLYQPINVVHQPINIVLNIKYRNGKENLSRKLLLLGRMTTAMWRNRAAFLMTGDLLTHLKMMVRKISWGMKQ